MTFVRVVRRCCCGSPARAPQTLMALPVRAAFAYKKKKDRREYVRVALRRAADGEIEAVKHPQDGAGVITSLTETDGLLEFPEDVTDDRAGRARRLSVLRGARWLSRRQAPEPRVGRGEGLVDRLLDAVEHERRRSRRSRWRRRRR